MATDAVNGTLRNGMTVEHRPAARRDARREEIILQRQPWEITRLRGKGCPRRHTKALSSRLRKIHSLSQNGYGCCQRYAT
mmetsp:Transcript_96/g.43  ORF Transcript_96/g.43 Transcript_96/m.43 type:complete len:80 (+) Transcript_96:166-405(+)